MLKGKVKKKSDRIYNNNKIKLLKFASIFGANASGKSNFIKAINFATSTLLSGEIDSRRGWAFKLDEEYSKKDTYFEFEILIDNKAYSYGFELNIENGVFSSEWLIELGASSEKIIFTRDIVNGEFESELSIKDTNIRNSFNLYASDLKKNREILFLNEMNSKAKSVLYENDDELIIFKKVYEWFLYKLDINYPDRPISNYSYFLGKNREEICNTISAFGTGITNFNFEHSTLDKLKDLPLNLRDKLEKDFEKIRRMDDKARKSFMATIRVNDEYYMVKLDDEDNIDVTTIVFNHGNKVLFGFSEESDGTRRLLDLIEILFCTSEKVYIIDELDRSLHPQLTYKFIDEFLKLAKKRNIQLIITTHEARLLDFDLLRQDEIWISDKSSKGETVLYSLDEYNVRFDQKIEKAYLEGRYGGVPIFNAIFPIGEA